MERPRYLQGCTVGEIRKEVKKNLMSLRHTGWMLANGFVSVDSPVTPELETFLNKTMTEYVIQAEYLRDREANNWGWDRNVVDFSKTAN